MGKPALRVSSEQWSTSCTHIVCNLHNIHRTVWRHTPGPVIRCKYYRQEKHKKKGWHIFNHHKGRWGQYTSILARNQQRGPRRNKKLDISPTATCTARRRQGPGRARHHPHTHILQTHTTLHVPHGRSEGPRWPACPHHSPLPASRRAERCDAGLTRPCSTSSAISPPARSNASLLRAKHTHKTETINHPSR